MQCSLGHALNVDEKFCSECGETNRRCPNGHLLKSGAKFCSECGVKTETTTLFASPHFTPTTEGARDSPPMASEISPAEEWNTEPNEAVTNSDSTLEPGDVVVMCCNCGFEESASGDEKGWQCGRCDTNWYVMSCGHCGEAQVVPQVTGRTTCIDCQKPLAKFEKYSERLAMVEVEPHERGFLKATNHSGVLTDSFTPGTNRVPLTGAEPVNLTENVGYDASQHRNAGVLCFVAAGLIAVSCFMPYVLITSNIGLSLGRTPFQFGAMETLSYQGPLILLGAAFFVFDGLRLMDVIAPDGGIRNTFPLASCIYSAAVIADAWSTSGWTGTSAVSIHLGYGGIIGVAGVAAGIVAIFVQRSA